MVSFLERGEKDKIYCIHKYFEQFNNIMKQKNSEEKKMEEFLKLSNDKGFVFTFNKFIDFFYFCLEDN